MTRSAVVADGVTVASAVPPSTTPGRSSRRPRGSVLSVTARAAAAEAITTLGTSTKKTARQLTTWVIALADLMRTTTARGQRAQTWSTSPTAGEGR